MKFSFKSKFRFKCKKCGGCCLQTSFSLTESELNILKEKISENKYEFNENTGSARNAFPYEVIFPSYCSFLDDKLCTIYDDRFMICRLYPLDISFLPNGELIVDLIHCNGVSKDEGNIVDQEYISTFMKGIEEYDKSFYDSFIKFRSLNKYESVSGFTFYDIVYPETKIYIRNYFINLFNYKIIREFPIEIKQLAILGIYNDNYDKIFKELLYRIGHSSTILSEPILLLNIDVKYALNQFKNIFEKEILEYVEKAKEYKYKILDEIIKNDMMTVEDEGATTEKKLSEEIEIILRSGEKKYLKLKKIVVDKKYTKNAILETNRYYVEILRRYGRAGFPITIPMKIILESLYQLTWLLYVQSKAYSLPKKNINKNAVSEAISYLDRRTILGGIIKKIYGEY